MKLLFITHKINERDDDFAFASLWAKEFIRQGFETEVICLEKGAHSGGFPVHSLGKESGAGRIKTLLKFWKLIFTLKYERVFVHMNPKWVAAGALYWRLKGAPIYLWYTHYTMHLPLKISHALCKRLFCATPESMPQYDKDPKKIVTGHGIDLSFWDGKVLPREERRPKSDLLSVHRICRSKRLHLAVAALRFLPPEYNLTVYGRVLEQDYYNEIKEQIENGGLSPRVHFMGSVPMPELRNIYGHYQIMINMAPETIDKTVIEGMFAGLQPVTTKGNALAIGLPEAPEDNPEAVANFILNYNLLPIEELRRMVREKHSLAALVKKMGQYIEPGI